MFLSKFPGLASYRLWMCFLTVWIKERIMAAWHDTPRNCVCPTTIESFQPGRHQELTVGSHLGRKHLPPGVTDFMRATGQEIRACLRSLLPHPRPFNSPHQNQAAPFQQSVATTSWQFSFGRKKPNIVLLFWSKERNARNNLNIFQQRTGPAIKG